MRFQYLVAMGVVAGTTLVGAAPSYAGPNDFPVISAAVTDAQPTAVGIFAYLKPAAGVGYSASDDRRPTAAAATDRQPSNNELRWRLVANTTDRHSARWRLKTTREAAVTWEFGYHALSIVDTVQTMACLANETCVEGNPLMGKNPSKKNMVATKLAISAFQLGMFKYAYDRDPKTALRMAQISCAIQGTGVLLNARFALH